MSVLGIEVEGKYKGIPGIYIHEDVKITDELLDRIEKEFDVKIKLVYYYMPKEYDIEYLKNGKRITVIEDNRVRENFNLCDTFILTINKESNIEDIWKLRDFDQIKFDRKVGDSFEVLMIPKENMFRTSPESYASDIKIDLKNLLFII